MSLFTAHAVINLNREDDGNLKINLHDLYPDIDIAESPGKAIRQCIADAVTFAEGTTEKINPVAVDKKEKQHFVSLIKSYLWWGE